MAPRLSPVLTITGIRGRSRADAPHALPDYLCREAWNMDLALGEIGGKRNGSTGVSLSSGPSSTILHLASYVAGSDQTAAELWAFSGSNTIHRKAVPTDAWTAVTPSPADTFALTQDASSVSFNGKLFFAANSNVNRLHCWDGTTFRRVGIAPPAGASEAKSAGAITDSRKYKAAVVVKVSSVVVRRSELSAASGAASLSAERATLTLVTAPGEGETHWEAYAASDDDNYATYRFIGDAAIGSTIVDNTNDITAYVTEPTSAEGVFEPIAGRNQLPPSCKYLATDGNRLLMAGAWESSAGTAQTTPKNNRVWFTPALGTTGAAYHDDERVSNTTDFKSWVDVGENDGDSITGLGVLDGIVYVFKRYRAYRLIPTGDPTVPYVPQEIAKSLGALTHNGIVPMTDEVGAAALYVSGPTGPYRISKHGGFDYLGDDLADICNEQGLVATVDYTNAIACPDPIRKRVLFRVTFPSNTRAQIAAYYPRLAIRDEAGRLRGGWAIWDVPTNYTINCMTQFGIGGQGGSGSYTTTDAQYPHVGGAGSAGAAKLWRYAESATQDDSNSFQAYFISKTFAPTEFRENFTAKPPTLVAPVGSNVTMQGIYRADFHASTDVEDSVTLAVGTGLASGSAVAASSETRIIKRLDALTLAGIRSLEVQLGDNTAGTQTWTLEHLTVPYEVAL